MQHPCQQLKTAKNPVEYALIEFANEGQNRYCAKAAHQNDAGAPIQGKA